MQTSFRRYLQIFKPSAPLSSLPISFTRPAAPLCDFDGGGCGLSDINLMMFQGDLTTGIFVGADNQFDLNNDNTINESDITEWLDLTGTESGYGSPFLRGDTDGMDNYIPHIAQG